MKNCNLTLAESGRQYNLAINPGTTPREIKQELALPASYQIGTPNKIFQDDEHIIEEIHDGEQLYASTPVVVGGSDDDDDDDDAAADDDDKKDSLSSFLQNIIWGLESPFNFSTNKRRNSYLPYKNYLEKEQKTYDFTLPLNVHEPPLTFPTINKCEIPFLNSDQVEKPLLRKIQNLPKTISHNINVSSHSSVNKKVTVLSGKQTVPQRTDKLYWEKKGWKKTKINTFEGFYSGGRYHLKGKAEQSPSGRLDLFIYDPPQKLLHEHPHGPCFIKIHYGLFAIHNNNTGYFDLSSAIIQVEQILKETSKL